VAYQRLLKTWPAHHSKKIAVKTDNPIMARVLRDVAWLIAATKVTPAEIAMPKKAKYRDASYRNQNADFEPHPTSDNQREAQNANIVGNPRTIVVRSSHRPVFSGRGVGMFTIGTTMSELTALPGCDLSAINVLFAAYASNLTLYKFTER
jgi:hypothetical protein